MSYLIDQYEIDIELVDYINQHALIIDMQANPIAIFSDTLSLLYANAALNNLLDTNESVATTKNLNTFFRGIEQVIKLSVSENKSKLLNKVVKDTLTEQLIPYKIKIIPIIRNKLCQGVYVIVETDVDRLVNYFAEEKSTLSDKISELSEKDKNTVKLVNTLFDNSPVGMMILDKSNRIIQINKSGANILDIEEKRAIGLPVSRFYSGESKQSVLDKNASKEIYVMTWGEEEKILLHCSAESIDQEQQPFSVETFMDVTSIENARVAAEKSNKSKSEFLANMSHELRTPLHTILGFSECGLSLDEKMDTEKTENFFKKIHHGGEVLLALVNNLLDVAKLETGKIVFNYKKVNFDVLVKDVIKEFSVIAADKEVSIILDVKNHIEPIDMDEMRMQQVVRNLISNAIKFSETGGEVTLAMEQYDDHIQLRVNDQGPGVPVDELENIFDKFIQSSRTNTGAGGTGLGLSICREILNQHNGIIWAENNPDGGAVFIVNQYLGNQAAQSG